MMKIGILGGGQLARMLAQAAQPLNVEIICVDPKEDCSAKKFGPVVHVALTDIAAIESAFHDVDLVTYETENLPIETVEAIAKKYKIFPGIEALKITQDRLYEKQLFNELTIPTVNYQAIDTWNDLKNAIEQFHFPIVLKTRRNGYDGKGQAVIRTWDDAQHAWNAMQHVSLIAEQFIPYQFEVSIISVRNQEGQIVFYPLVLNKHQEGILRVSEAPFIHEELRKAAEHYAACVLEKLSYVGVMTIEFFCVNNKLLANEIAPRVHNSGHWTIEGAESSQFENHIRAIAGLPLGSTKSKAFSAMINLIGKQPEIQDLPNLSELHYHWYDKLPLANRKLGHITICALNHEELKLNLEQVLHSLK